VLLHAIAHAIERSRSALDPLAELLSRTPDTKVSTDTIVQ
jgi:hypothetical protein